MVFNADDFLSSAGNPRNTTRGTTTGFTENVAAAVNSAVETDLTISRQLSQNEEMDRVIEQLRERGVGEDELKRLNDARDPTRRESRRGATERTQDDFTRRRGAPPPQIGLPEQPDHIERFFAEVRKLPEDKTRGLPKTPTDLNVRVNEKAQEAEARERDVAGRAGALGVAGNVAGNIAGTMVDPPLLAATVLTAPASGAALATRFGLRGASRIAATAAAEGAVAGATEIPLQVDIQRDRAATGLDAGFGRGAQNVAFATLGGAALGGAFDAAGQAIRYGRSKFEARRKLAEAQGDPGLDPQDELLKVVREQGGSVTDRTRARNVERQSELEADLPRTGGLPNADRVARSAYDELLASAQGRGATRTDIATPVDGEPETPSAPDTSSPQFENLKQFVDKRAATLQNQLGQKLKQRVDESVDMRTQRAATFFQKAINADAVTADQRATRLNALREIGQIREEYGDVAADALSDDARERVRESIQALVSRKATKEDLDAFVDNTVRGRTAVADAADVIQNGVRADQRAGSDQGFIIAASRAVDETIAGAEARGPAATAGNRAQTDAAAAQREAAATAPETDAELEKMVQDGKEGLANEDQDLKVRINLDGKEEELTVKDLRSRFAEEDNAIKLIETCQGATDMAKCLRDMAQQPGSGVTSAKAEEIGRRFNRILGEQDGDRQAAEFVFRNSLKADVRQRQWKGLNQIRAVKQARDRVIRHLNNGAKPREVAVSLFEFVPKQNISDPSLYRQQDALRRNAQAAMSSAIEAFKANNLGGAPRRPGANEDNIVREVMGEKTSDDEAKAIAQGIFEAMEYLRTEFNRQGGSIPKRDHYMPQSHDPDLVAKAGKDRWKKRMRDLLDRSQMIDHETAEPMTDAKLNKVLDDAYESITQRGLNKADPENDLGLGQSITGRHQNGRFFQFKDADSWLQYHREFGVGGGPNADGKAISAVLTYIDNMARDTATMRVLGPSPDATKRVVNTELQQRAGSSQGDMMDRLFAEATGQLNSPELGEGQKVAGFGIGTRHLINSALLGSATISAIADIGFSHTAARMNGLGSNNVFMGRLMGRALKQMDPFDPTARQQARRVAAGAESTIENLASQDRITGDLFQASSSTASGKLRLLNQAVMRASLLTPWTQSMKYAYHTEMLGTLTDQLTKGNKLADMNPKLRDMLERNGIDEEMWARIAQKKNTVQFDSGADFIDPWTIARNGDKDASLALSSMLSAEAEFAVPSNLLTARSFWRGGTRAGTATGEGARFVGQLKNFPTTVLMLQNGRMAQRRMKGTGKSLGYAAELLLTTGMLGALATQLDTLSEGKKPRPFAPGEEGAGQFWLDSLQRAGTFGFAGDVLFNSFNSGGFSMASSLAGPAINTAFEGTKAVASGGETLGRAAFTDESLEQALEETNAARDLLDFAGGLVPGQNLWWLKTALNRTISDRIQAMADPEAERSFERQKQWVEDQGTEFFEFTEPNNFE